MGKGDGVAQEANRESYIVNGAQGTEQSAAPVGLKGINGLANGHLHGLFVALAEGFDSIAHGLIDIG